MKRSLTALLILLLAACSPAMTAVAPAAPPSLSPPPPTLALSPTPEPTATHTAIRTPGATPAATLTPTPTPMPPVRFAVIGDYGLAGTPAAEVAALVLGFQPDFILTTGDNNYYEGAPETIDANIGQYYHAYIAPYTGSYGPGAETNRFFPSLGNHDWITAEGQAYFDYFTLPGNERYYDFTWGPLHVFILDSDSREPDGVGRSSVQAAWLQEQMAASSLPWQIVVFHHAPYASGYHLGTDWMRWPFEAWGADAVLSGHDHVYERLQVGGIPYFISGLGGAARYDFTLTDPHSGVRFNADHGALLVTATAAQLTFEFHTRAGELVDTYVLIPAK